MGVKKLRKIQLGRETTAGTAVAATTIWRGLGAIEDAREVVFADEDVGFLSGIDRAYQPSLLARLSMDAVPATFEQVIHVLEAGVKTVIPSRDGTGSGYVWTHTFPTNAANTIKTYTLEGGDNQQAEEMEYAFVEAFAIEGKPKEAVTMQADWVGRQVSASSFTTAATLPAVSEILFQKALLYVDTTTMGNTLKSNTLLGFSLKVKTGWVPVFAGDGQLYFSFAKSVEPEILLDVTFEHDSTATSEKAAYRAGTARLVRLLITGPALGTASTYTYKTLQIDVAGKWEKFDKLGEQDGNDIVTGTLRGRYHTTAARFSTVTVVNELSAAP